MAGNKDTAVLSARVSKSLAKHVDELAEQAGMSRAALIEQSLKRMVLDEELARVKEARSG